MKDHKWQGCQVYFQVLESSVQVNWYWIEYEYNVPPQIWWTYWKGQSSHKRYATSILQSLSKFMDQVFTSRRVCLQLFSSHKSWNVTFQSSLWERMSSSSQISKSLNWSTSYHSNAWRYGSTTPDYKGQSQDSKWSSKKFCRIEMISKIIKNKKKERWCFWGLNQREIL